MIEMIPVWEKLLILYEKSVFKKVINMEENMSLLSYILLLCKDT